MICLEKAKQYCRENITKIKNYDLAIADNTQMWDCHHINGLTFTRKELKKMKMYFHRPANELIFLTKTEHKKLHNGTKEFKQKISEAQKGNTYKKGITCSEFGEKFKKHFGITKIDDKKLYKKEHEWYRLHNKRCRWEVL